MTVGRIAGYLRAAIRMLALLVALCASAASYGRSPAEAESLLRITEEAHGLVSGGPQVRVIVEIRGDTPERKKFIRDLWKRYSDAFQPDYRIH